MPAKLTSRLPEIAAELPVRMDAVAKQGAELVEGRAKARAPDRPPIGEGLVEAIHVERERAGSYEVVAGDGDVFYGHMVEHGTSHSAPRPFLVPSLEESRDDVTALAQAALGGL